METAESHQLLTEQEQLSHSEEPPGPLRARQSSHLRLRFRRCWIWTRRALLPLSRTMYTSECTAAKLQRPKWTSEDRGPFRRRLLSLPVHTASLSYSTPLATMSEQPQEQYKAKLQTSRLSNGKDHKHQLKRCRKDGEAIGQGHSRPSAPGIGLAATAALP